MEIFAGYIRVSTDDQTEYSPDSQMKLLRERAEKDGGMIPEEYMFADPGISGKDAAHRPEFNRMIALAKQKDPPFRRIYVWKFSRFARNQEESIVFKNMLRKNGVEIVSISEPLVEGAFGSLIERIIEWQDEYYLINLSGEVKRGMMEKASRGEAMCRVFGLDIKDLSYVKNADNPHVVDIFESFDQGENLRSIAKRLDAAGVRTPRGNSPDIRFVEYILRNPIYIKKLRWSSEGNPCSKRRYDDPNIKIFDAKAPRTVSDELFYRVQKRLDDRKALYARSDRPNTGRPWLLKGIAKCDCGGSLVFASAKEPSVQCNNYNHMRGCTVSHHISQRKLFESFVIGLRNCCALDRYDTDPDAPIKKASESAPADFQKLIAAEERKLARCAAAFQAGIDTMEEYAKNKAEIQKRINALEQEASRQANKLSPESAKAASIEDYRTRTMALIHTLEDPEIPIPLKNDATRSLISRVVFHKPDNTLSIFFK
ncbi:MAG: recombinase family protein [Clostridia bacterium]|nr:recombinase family protein [Clostridia bacterium]